MSTKSHLPVLDCFLRISAVQALLHSGDRCRKCQSVCVPYRVSTIRAADLRTCCDEMWRLPNASNACSCVEELEQRLIRFHAYLKLRTVRNKHGFLELRTILNSVTERYWKIRGCGKLTFDLVSVVFLVGGRAFSFLVVVNGNNVFEVCNWFWGWLKLRVFLVWFDREKCRDLNGLLEKIW